MLNIMANGCSDKAFDRIGHLYPQVDLPAQQGGGKANVIAWFGLALCCQALTGFCWC